MPIWDFTNSPPRSRPRPTPEELLGLIDQDPFGNAAPPLISNPQYAPPLGQQSPADAYVGRAPAGLPGRYDYNAESDPMQAEIDGMIANRDARRAFYPDANVPPPTISNAIEDAERERLLRQAQQQIASQRIGVRAPPTGQRIGVSAPQESAFAGSEMGPDLSSTPRMDFPDNRPAIASAVRARIGQLSPEDNSAIDALIREHGTMRQGSGHVQHKNLALAAGPGTIPVTDRNGFVVGYAPAGPRPQAQAEPVVSAATDEDRVNALAGMQDVGYGQRIYVRQGPQLGRDAPRVGIQARTPEQEEAMAAKREAYKIGVKQKQDERRSEQTTNAKINKYVMKGAMMQNAVKAQQFGGKQGEFQDPFAGWSPEMMAAMGAPAQVLAPIVAGRNNAAQIASDQSIATGNNETQRYVADQNAAGRQPTAIDQQEADARTAAAGLPPRSGTPAADAMVNQARAQQLAKPESDRLAAARSFVDTLGQNIPQTREAAQAALDQVGLTPALLKQAAEWRPTLPFGIPQPTVTQQENLWQNMGDGGVMETLKSLGGNYAFPALASAIGEDEQIGKERIRRQTVMNQLLSLLGAQ